MKFQRFRHLYKVINEKHVYNAWELYNLDETNCENKLYYRICRNCSSIEWKEGKYEDHNFKTVTTKPNCQAVNYEIHPDTVIIAGKAFSQCYYLQSIEIPEKVVSIGDVAFC